MDRPTVEFNKEKVPLGPISGIVALILCAPAIAIIFALVLVMIGACLLALPGIAVSFVIAKTTGL